MGGVEHTLKLRMCEGLRLPDLAGEDQLLVLLHGMRLLRPRRLRRGSGTTIRAKLGTACGEPGTAPGTELGPRCGSAGGWRLPLRGPSFMVDVEGSPSRGVVLHFPASRERVDLLSSRWSRALRLLHWDCNSLLVMLLMMVVLLVVLLVMLALLVMLHVVAVAIGMLTAVARQRPVANLQHDKASEQASEREA